MDELDRTDWHTNDLCYEIHCTIQSLELFFRCHDSEEALWVVKQCQKIERLKRELQRRIVAPSLN